MADNVAITAGSGVTVGTDEVVDGTLGTVQIQFVKLMDGTLNGTGKLAILAEDAASAGGETGIQLLGVRRDTQSSTANADGDFVPLQFDSQGGARVTAAGYTATPTATLTRPANTTAYTAGDEMTDTGGAILTFSGCARFTGGTGTVVGAQIAVNSKPTTLPSLELWLYNTTSTPQTDNAAFAPSGTVTGTCVGVLPLSLSYIGDPTATTGNFFLDTGAVNLPFTTSGSANLFGRIVVRNAYTAAANSDTYKVTLRIACD